MVPCNYCGPNMSPQLTREFVAAGLHFRLQTKGFNWLDWVAFYSYGRVIWMAQTGPLLDWTNISDSGYVDEVAISCPTGRACKKTYELCGHCVHDHVIGNIMFGYWMRLMGFSSITTDLAGDGAQICLDGDIGCEPVNWVDFEWDQAAYRIGEKIYDNAAESNYCDVITVGEWKAANGGEFYNPICALCPLPSYNAPVKKYPPYMGGLDE